MDRFVDVAFTIDIIFNFFTPYFDKETNIVIEVPWHIAHRYCRGILLYMYTINFQTDCSSRMVYVRFYLSFAI